MKKHLVKTVHNNYFFTASLAFLVWFVLSDNFARMAGTLFPVVDHLVIESATPYNRTSLPSTRIVGRTVKNYNCDFIGMEWTVEEHGVSGTASSYFLDPPQGRHSGDIGFTGIIVGLTPDRLNVAESDVIHECYGVKVITEWYGD